MTKSTGALSENQTRGGARGAPSPSRRAASSRGQGVRAHGGPGSPRARGVPGSAVGLQPPRRRRPPPVPQCPAEAEPRPTMAGGGAPSSCCDPGSLGAGAWLWAPPGRRGRAGLLSEHLDVRPYAAPARKDGAGPARGLLTVPHSERDQLDARSRLRGELRCYLHFVQHKVAGIGAHRRPAKPGTAGGPGRACAHAPAARSSGRCGCCEAT